MGTVEQRARPRTNPLWEAAPQAVENHPRVPAEQPPAGETVRRTASSYPHPTPQPQPFAPTKPPAGSRFPPDIHTRRLSGAGGNPLAEAEEGLAKQRHLAAKVAVVAHLALDLRAGMDDGGVVAATEGGADAHQRRISLFA